MAGTSSRSRAISGNMLLFYPVDPTSSEVRINGMAKILWVASLCTTFLTACSPLGVVNGLVPSSTYTREMGISYGALPRQQLDVYHPLEGQAPADGERPVVVFFYGGNWINGDRADYKFVGEALAAHGAIVVIPDYRLSPEATYPAFVQDSALAVRWALDNAARLGGNLKRVYVMGHSAGAYLAAMVALDDRWLRATGTAPSALAGWVGLAGPYDFLPIGDPVTRVAFNWPQTATDSQPMRHVSAASPPALLMAATHDTLVDPDRNTSPMAQALRRAGVPVATQEFDDLSHVTLIGAMARPLQWIGGPVLPPILSFLGLADARAPDNAGPPVRTVNSTEPAR